jgi:hypothetical protein
VFQQAYEIEKDKMRVYEQTDELMTMSRRANIARYVAVKREVSWCCNKP